jgi:hypothetical protein
MRLVPVVEGVACTVYALDPSGSGRTAQCPAEVFLSQLPRISRQSLVRTITKHAERGPLKIEAKSRSLGNGIFEFKTRQGDRLLYFYGGSRTTILTHGFRKGAKVSQERTRAEHMRRLWEEEQR